MEIILLSHSKIAHWMDLGKAQTWFHVLWLYPSNLSPSILQNEDTEQQIIRETFHLVSKRDENVCNFLEGGM